MRTRSCRSATRRRGLTQGRGSAQGRTRAVSACPRRATRSARSRQRALCSGAQQCQLHLTACDRYGARRVSRAAQGGTGLWCRPIVWGEGPPPRGRTSCPGCTCASSCTATHGTEARACWGQRTNSTTLHRPWSPYATGTGPLRRPQALGRHDEPQSPEPPPGSACCWYVSDGGKTVYCAPDEQTTSRRCLWGRGQSQRTGRPPQDRPACTSRASSCLGLGG